MAIINKIFENPAKTHDWKNTCNREKWEESKI